jgi:hypothetical protein
MVLPTSAGARIVNKRYWLLATGGWLFVAESSALLIYNSLQGRFILIQEEKKSYL